VLTPEALSRLWQEHAADLECDVRSFALADGTAFEFDKRAYLMGVVNLSPDSWYRESVCLTVPDAVERARKLQLSGASIVDIGAESTLPNARLVDAAEQRGLLSPIVSELSGLGVPVSVETYHAEVAAACLGDGAAVVNLTGVTEREEIYRLAAKHDAAVIICFVAGENVRAVDEIPEHDDWVAEQKEYFREQIEVATRLGVTRIWLDPGLGFYYRNLTDGHARIAYQLQTFLQTFRLRSLGWPLCHALPHAFTLFKEEVRQAEAFFAVSALLGKTSLLRTHEVAKVRPVLEAMQVT